LRSRGFGLERPIADNGSESGRRENRRVEFHIRKVNGKDLDEHNGVRAGGSSVQQEGL